MSRFPASLLGGLFIGILSALPVVQIANCCCLWVIVGGVLTTYLLQQGRPVSVVGFDAAVSGLLAGLIGALISVGIGWYMFAASGGAMETQVRDVIDQYPQLPPEVRDLLLSAAVGPHFMALVAVVTVPVYAIVGAVGALLGLAVIRKPSPPAPPA